MRNKNILNGLKVVRCQVVSGQCPECATVHPPEMPHNQTSLYWQYSFAEKHGRWPTWNDAMAHCTPEMRGMWVAELAKRGIVVEEKGQS